jgi:hypothetical protein
MAGLYEADFVRDDDEELDSELIRIEDGRMSLEAIVAICRKHGVRARIMANGKLIGEFVPTKK